MTKDSLNGIRKLLIRVGKILPFVICFVVLVSYIENGYALMNEDYLYYDGYYVLNKPLSNQLGILFEYNIQMLFTITLVSFAIRTCIFNKLACLYLGCNLYEKSYFMEHVYNNEIYYVVIAINIIIASWITIKGIIIFLKNIKIFGT